MYDNSILGFKVEVDVEERNLGKGDLKIPQVAKEPSKKYPPAPLTPS